MKAFVSIFSGAIHLLILTSATLTAAEPDRFPLPAAPLSLVQEDTVFAAFAETVRGRVEALLAEPARLDDPATLQRLLALRVHLAHHIADNERATATAAWIRTLQTEPAERAYAGLTSLAAIAARRELPDRAPDDAAYRRAFDEHFSRLLADLPGTPEMLTVLRRQRERTAALTRKTILADLGKISEALGGRRDCSLAEADEIVRAFHRLHRLLPVRNETLAALDAAIETRSRP
jgi:hypothetical protein